MEQSIHYIWAEVSALGVTAAMVATDNLYAAGGALMLYGAARVRSSLRTNNKISRLEEQLSLEPLPEPSLRDSIMQLRDKEVDQSQYGV